MNIRWTPEATADLERISQHIAEDNREAALKMVRSIFSRIEELITFPNRGRKGREGGTRELVLSPLPWVVVYRVLPSEAIQILRIWHGAQQRQE